MDSVTSQSPKIIGSDGEPPIQIAIFHDDRCSPITRNSISDSPAFQLRFKTGDLSDARAQTVSLKPEAILICSSLVDGPGMTFLKELHRNWPIPVILVNNADQNQGEVALAGIQNGAHIVVDAPTGANADTLFAKKTLRILWPLLRKGPVPDAIPQNTSQPNVQLKCSVEPLTAPLQLITIGASTGGLRSLARVLDFMPEGGPPILVVQHIKLGYIERTAARIDGYYAWNTTVAQEGRPLRPNQIQFAPDGQHLRIHNENGLPVPRLCPARPSDHFVPAADHLFDSAADAFGPQAAGVILTGMGRDGTEGLLRLRRTGARCLGESEESCVVYGMPKSAMAAGAVDMEMTAEQIGLYLGELCRMSATTGFHDRSIAPAKVAAG